MKTCLGSLLLVPVILALVITAVYHTSVNSELQFEKRDTNAQYINTARSYRPQIKEQPVREEAPATAPTKEDKNSPAPAGSVPGLVDDDVAEEV